MQYDVGMGTPTQAANQGGYLGIQQAQNIVNIAEKMNTMGRKDLLQNQLSEINRVNTEKKQSATYEQLLDAYQKYGDAADVDRVQGKIDERDRGYASTKLQLYIAQHKAAAESGNMGALKQIQDNLNKDPHIQKTIGSVELFDDGKMSYLQNQPGQIMMSDGQVHDVPQGAKVTGAVNHDTGKFVATDISAGTTSMVQKTSTGKSTTAGIISPAQYLAFTQWTMDGKPTQFGYSGNGMDNVDSPTQIAVLLERALNAGEVWRAKVGTEQVDTRNAQLNKTAYDSVMRLFNAWGAKNKGKTFADWAKTLSKQDVEALKLIDQQ